MVVLVLGNVSYAVQASTENRDYLLVHQAYIESAREAGNVFDEYDQYMSMRNLPKSKLIEIGYSTEFANSIHSGELEKNACEEIYRRAELSKDALTKMGYSIDEIKILRNLQGDESLEVLSAYGLLASCTVYNNLNDYYYRPDEDTTYYRVSFGWTWDKCPLNRWTECFAISWNQYFYLDTNAPVAGYDVVCNRVYRQYYNMEYETYTLTAAEDVYENLINKIQYQFPLVTTEYNLINYAKSGYGVVALKQEGYVGEAKCTVAYAHSYIGVTPTINNNLELEISFSGNVDVFTPNRIVGSIESESVPRID